MVRWLAIAVFMVLTMGAGIFAYESFMGRDPVIPPAPAMMTTAAAAEPEAESALPIASAKTREEKRFGRFDKDKDGAVTRAEYLLSRQKAFAKLDRNGNGQLEFEEYAVKATEKFATADADRSGAMTPAEFATTAVKRKPKPVSANCPPPRAAEPEDGDSAT